MYTTSNQQAVNTLSRFLLIVSMLVALSTAHADSYALLGYGDGNCNGSPLSITLVNSTCNVAGAAHPFKRSASGITYEYSECSEEGLLIYSCEDSLCQNCTGPMTFSVNNCSSTEGASSQTICSTGIPVFPDQDYRVLATYTEDGCAGNLRTEYLEAISLDKCTLVRGHMTYYTVDVCFDDGTYERLRCSDSACTQCSPMSIMSGCNGATNISCVRGVETFSGMSGDDNEFSVRSLLNPGDIPEPIGSVRTEEDTLLILKKAEEDTQAVAV